MPRVNRCCVFYIGLIILKSMSSYQFRLIPQDPDSIAKVVELRKKAYGMKYQGQVELNGLNWNNEDQAGYHFGAYKGDQLISCLRLIEIKSARQFEATMEFPADHEFAMTPSFSLARAATDANFQSNSLNMRLRYEAYRFIKENFPNQQTYIYGTALAKSKRIDYLREIGYEVLIHQRAWKRFLFSGDSDIAIFRLPTVSLESALRKIETQI